MSNEYFKKETRDNIIHGIMKNGVTEKRIEMFKKGVASD